MEQDRKFVNGNLQSCLSTITLYVYNVTPYHNDYKRELSVNVVAYNG